MTATEVKALEQKQIKEFAEYLATHAASHGREETLKCVQFLMEEL